VGSPKKKIVKISKNLIEHNIKLNKPIFTPIDTEKKRGRLSNMELMLRQGRQQTKKLIDYFNRI
jgi:hypothetical protein